MSYEQTYIRGPLTKGFAEKKKSNKIGQDQKTFIFAFAQFWPLLPKNYLWKYTVSTRNFEISLFSLILENLMS